VTRAWVLVAGDFTPLGGMDRANHALADIYRRLGKLVLSDQALRRALVAGIEPDHRAYILNDGKIEVSGSAQDVLYAPIDRKFYLGQGCKL